MKQQNEKRTGLPRFIMPLAYGSLTCFILVGFTFSWLQRQATPSVQGNNITIQTEGSLAFALSENSSTSTGNLSDTINIRNYSGGLFENLVFSPVSNYTGESTDFFKMAYANDFTDAHFVKVEQGTSSLSKMAADNGYFEISFQLIANTDSESQKSKYIYLSDESYIKINDDSKDSHDDPSSAFRISLTDHTNGKTFLMRNGVESKEQPTAKNGLSFNLDSDIPYKKIDGEKYFTYCLTNRAIKNQSGDEAVSDDNPYWYYVHENGAVVNYNTGSGDPEYHRAGDTGFRLTSTEIYPLSHFFDPFKHETDGEGNIVYDIDGNPTKTEEVDNDTGHKRYLLEMKPGGHYNLTLRVWLEGEDDVCIDSGVDSSILGSGIDMKIVFACQDYDSTK